MDKLAELYMKRNVFLEYRMPVPQALVDDILAQESAVLINLSNSLKDTLPASLGDSSTVNAVIAANYVNGCLAQVGMSRDLDFNAIFGNSVMDVSFSEDSVATAQSPDAPLSSQNADALPTAKDITETIVFTPAAASIPSAENQPGEAIPASTDSAPDNTPHSKPVVEIEKPKKIKLRIPEKQRHLANILIKLHNLKDFAALGTSGPHKAVLLAAIFECYKRRLIGGNRFKLSVDLEVTYGEFWKRYMKSPVKIGAGYPYMQLADEPFVTQELKQPLPEGEYAWSRANVKEYVKCSYLDNEFVEALRDPQNIKYLQAFLVNHYCKPALAVLNKPSEDLAEAEETKKPENPVWKRRYIRGWKFERPDYKRFLSRKDEDGNAPFSMSTINAYAYSVSSKGIKNIMKEHFAVDSIFDLREGEDLVKLYNLVGSANKADFPPMIDASLRHLMAFWNYISFGAVDSPEGIKVPSVRRVKRQNPAAMAAEPDESATAVETGSSDAIVKDSSDAYHTPEQPSATEPLFPISGFDNDPMGLFKGKRFVTDKKKEHIDSVQEATSDSSTEPKEPTHDNATETSEEVAIEAEKLRKKRDTDIVKIVTDDFTIDSGSSVWKFIQFVRLIDPELVYEMKFPLYGRFLVDTTPNPKYEAFSHDVGKGYWLNTNIPPAKRIEYIREIAERCEINVEITTAADLD